MPQEPAHNTGQNTATAADSTGMANAAKANAPNLTGVTGSASQSTCGTGSTVNVLCDELLRE